MSLPRWLLAHRGSDHEPQCFALDPMVAGFAAQGNAGDPMPHFYAKHDCERPVTSSWIASTTTWRTRSLVAPSPHARHLIARPDVWSAVTLLARKLLARETLWTRDWRCVGIAAARLVHGRRLSARGSGALAGFQLGRAGRRRKEWVACRVP